jgi:hypothetical protein
MAFNVESFRAAMRKSLEEDTAHKVCQCGHQYHEHEIVDWGCFGPSCTRDDCWCWGFVELDISEFHALMKEAKCLSSTTKNSSTTSDTCCGISEKSKTTSGTSPVPSAVTLGKRKSEPEDTSTAIETA